MAEVLPGSYSIWDHSIQLRSYVESSYSSVIDKQFVGQFSTQLPQNIGKEKGSSSVDLSCSCLVPFVSEVASISTSVYFSLSPLSFVFGVFFSSFLVIMGDGILPK